MKIAARNVILVIAISIIALMIVGIFLYDYIPTGMQVSQAKVYQADSNTITALSDASDAQDLVLPSSNSSSPSQIARTEIVLQTYDLTKADYDGLKFRYAKDIGGRVYDDGTFFLNIERIKNDIIKLNRQLK